MKSVMYHYVRKPIQDLPFFKALDFDDFVKQLDYFEAKFGIADFEDVLSLSRGEVVNKVFLTFDDGVIDHYKFVLPELKRRGVTGIFYIPIKPYLDQKLLDVHKIHLILGSTQSDLILEQLYELINDEMIEHREEFESRTYIHQQNDECTIRVKQILNYFIKYECREEVIDVLFKKNVGNESEICKDFYMSIEQLKEMISSKMIVGSHSVSHSVFSRLDYSKQFDEICDSFGFVNNFCGEQDIKTFCYPYGGSHTYNNSTINILNNVDCDFSFSVEHRDITKDDLDNKRQELPRYDCNIFPHGQCRT